MHLRPERLLQVISAESNFIKKFIKEYDKYKFLRGIMSVYTKEPLNLAEKNIILQWRMADGYSYG